MLRSGFQEHRGLRRRVPRWSGRRRAPRRHTNQWGACDGLRPKRASRCQTRFSACGSWMPERAAAPTTSGVSSSDRLLARSTYSAPRYLGSRAAVSALKPGWKSTAASRAAAACASESRKQGRGRSPRHPPRSRLPVNVRLDVAVQRVEVTRSHLLDQSVDAMEVDDAVGLEDRVRVAERGTRSRLGAEPDERRPESWGCSVRVAEVERAVHGSRVGRAGVVSPVEQTALPTPPIALPMRSEPAVRRPRLEL